jgi:hypothetical protein
MMLAAMDMAWSERAGERECRQTHLDVFNEVAVVELMIGILQQQQQQKTTTTTATA